MLDIKVLGPGCKNCLKLESLVREVVNEIGVQAKIEKVTDPNKFIEYGIMLTPALVVNGKVLVSGKIPTKQTLEYWLKNFTA